ncbi:hypothetical protein [Asticcacaulis solisilvae]|uniref:hypothetical protein n=1 Tax=Asticcacaulis solisilvae TaxID=1217274 RepID=UPI003FD8CDC4
MPDRSPVARSRPPLARIHHKVQIATYAVAGLPIVLAVLSPDFARTIVHALIALILN